MDNKEFLVELLARENLADEIKRESERLFLAVPELEAMVGFEHCHPHHHLDVWEHTLLALSLSKNQLTTRMALLLHDIGKPSSYQEEGSVRHYKGHAERSAELAQAILNRLRFEEDFVNEVIALIRHHDIPLSEEEIDKSPRLSREIFDVQRCDALAHNPEYNQKRLAYIEKIEKIFIA